MLDPMRLCSVYWPMRLREPPEIVDMWFPTHPTGNQLTERYFFPDWWCIHLYRYEAELSLDGEVLHVRPGSAGLIPPGIKQEYRYVGRSEHAFAHFKIPRSKGPEVETDTLRLCALQDLGPAFEETYSDFEEAIGAFRVRPRQAEARLWDILWRLVDRSEVADPERLERHPAVEKVLRAIELRLSSPLSLADLAREVGLSQGHLTRLFREALGETVVSYVRRRRLERAKHLLVHSDIPIKQVAAEAGVPDVHVFNKLVRRTFGASPKQVRRRELRD